MNWYLGAFSKYAEFDGRAGRPEYWYFMLFHTVAFLAALFVDGLVLAVVGVGAGIVSGLYTLVSLIPSISLTVRRLHDAGHNGWWLLMIFVPLIGGLVFLVFTLQQSEREANQWGPIPAGTEPLAADL